MTIPAKRWAIALALSGALNFFLLGAIAMHLLRPTWMHRGRGGAPGGGEAAPALLREMIRTVGGPRDPRVQKLWVRHRSEWSSARREVREAREKVREALTREPFEEKGLEGALAQLKEAAARAQLHSGAAILSLAKELSAEERRRLRVEERLSPEERRRPRVKERHE